MTAFSRYLAILALVLPVLAVGGASAQEEATDEVVATVNGTPIRYSDISFADEEMSAALARLEPNVRFQYLLGLLIDRRIVALAAEEKNVGDDPAVKRRQEYFNEKALRDFYWVQLMQDRVSDEAVRAWYDENIASAPPEREANARHILVETEAEAKAIADEIAAGKSFEDAANEHSRDGSGQNGGDLGWFARGDMVDAFGDAVFSMEPGDISAPVQSQFGWHLIKVIDFRDMEKPTLEEAQEDIFRQLAREEGQKLIESLREQAKIEIIGVGEAAPSGGRPQIVPQQ
ncbi:MAG: peptidylprolyl isomerase [Alphaproteobacteria bacterium]|nr:peptidylprolyl isomerase [Alphaproteobacteria bacterium]MDX5417354.1 peptidylprolyl isomerase [Alphaproteobacteria bacterium]MDX5494814.1 peptidylprolyl isomerase [Alphaproteobacteria bacterium]